jgi:hypothetical protein
MRLVLLSLLALVACTTPAPPSAGPASPVSIVDAGLAVTADASLAVTTVDAAAPRTPIAEGPPKWRTVPREQNGFYTVLDGLCSQLSVGRVGKDVVVHYGGGGNTMFFNGLRRGEASFIALRDDGLESIGNPVVMSPTGIAGSSLDDFWVADSTGSRSSEGAILHRYQAGKWKTYQKDQTNLHAWLDGGIIGSLGFAAANGDLWVEGSSTKPPAALYDSLPYLALSAFPTGDVLVVASKGQTTGDRGPLLARHWAPGKKVTELVIEKLLPAGATYEWLWLHEVAPDEVYAVRGDRVARWDGTAWHALAKTNKGEAIKLVRRAASDDLWAITSSDRRVDAKTVAGTLQRITTTSATVIATPEPIVDMDGIDRGGAWIVGQSGALYRREGEQWVKKPLPLPAFTAGSVLKAKGVVVVAPDDVLLTAMYWEKAPGWKEQELHTALFRTKAVKETLRCNEPDPENNNLELGFGFQSWPPMATEACKTPFAVLARRSKAIKNDDDWPRIRAALKGHPELGEIALVDFVSGDRTFVGVKGKDLETVKKIAALVAQKERVRPEVVCGDPEPKRTLAIDLVSGAATAK